MRPNGTQNHYALASYLYRQNYNEELLKLVTKLARIYPPSYHKLKTEDFWSPDVEAACRQGLQAAIRENNLPAEAHKSLSYITEKETDWAGAAAHYEQALRLEPRNRKDQSYFRLGRLFLNSENMQAARESFLEGLSLSQTRHKHVEQLYRTFKNQDRLDEFIDFFPEVQQRFSLSDQTVLLLARALIDLKRHGRARRIIEELNDKAPSGEAYYWLARIAEQKEDWDQMELAIQKATVLEPENNRYRQVFFSVLKRMKKYESAERQLDLMIEYADKPSAGLYNQKAWLRWNQKEYDTALEAWQKAIALKSDTAAYHAQAAEAYIKLGNLPKAEAYYQEAAKLDPQNERYSKRYREITGDGTES